MRTSAPIITCDSEDGCDQWTYDWYTGTASNWRELMQGWHYDPYSLQDEHFCPRHLAEASS